MLTTIYTKVQDVYRSNGNSNGHGLELCIWVSTYFEILGEDRKREVLTVSPSWLPVNIEVISLVHPINNRPRATIALPKSRNGLRLPNFEVHLSDKTPTIGCINRPDDIHVSVNLLSVLLSYLAVPDRGPAIHTNDIEDFDKPKESKYGVPWNLKQLLQCSFTAINYYTDNQPYAISTVPVKRPW